MSPFVVVRLLICSSLFLAAPTFAQKSQKNEAPLDVIVQSVAARDLQNNIEALGNLRAYESTVITAKTTKTVTSIHFDDGQRVSKGTVLVEMTNAEESALMDEARLTANEAKKQLDRTEALAKT